MFFQMKQSPAFTVFLSINTQLITSYSDVSTAHLCKYPKYSPEEAPGSFRHCRLQSKQLFQKVKCRLIWINVAQAGAELRVKRRSEQPSR